MISQGPAADGMAAVLEDLEPMLIQAGTVGIGIATALFAIGFGWKLVRHFVAEGVDDGGYWGDDDEQRDYFNSYDDEIAEDLRDRW